MVVRRKPKILFFVLIIFFIIIVSSILFYFYNISPVDSNSNEEIEVVIPEGTSSIGIGKILKEKDLIKNTTFFRIYVMIHKVKSMKASNYLFRKDMNLSEIVSTLENGSSYNPNVIILTFKEGQRITDYAKIIENNTNHSFDEVINIINNKEYIKKLINQYWFMTDEILNPNIYYPLEGYLAPNTYHFDNKDVAVEDIIETMLNQTNKELLAYKNIIENNFHYYFTMASIVELEGTNMENRKMIVGVFENRLASNMNLGSDVTTYYGLQVAMTSDLSREQFSSSNAYNTRSTDMIGKMPVGPICNPSIESIEASLNPIKSDYLFFVADKNGKIYYSKTMREHEKLIQDIKDKGNWIW